MPLDEATMKAAEAQEGPHNESCEFTLPEGVEIEQGKEQDVVCTIRNMGNGMGCLVAVEGNPVGGSPSTEQEPDGDEADSGDITSRYRNFQSQSEEE